MSTKRILKEVPWNVSCYDEDAYGPTHGYTVFVLAINEREAKKIAEKYLKEYDASFSCAKYQVTSISKIKGKVIGTHLISLI